MKECVVVLGMHRSGTSVLSGLVSSQGYYLGPDEMPSREDNPKGFFENMKVYRLNQSILEACDTSWDNHFFTCDQIPPPNLYEYELQAKKIIKAEFGLVKKIFIKDPRMCLLFPLWEKVLLEMGYNIKIILAYRSPMEVAHSLKSRNDMDIEKSLMLWSHYFFQAEKTSRNYDRLVVRYSDDFQDLDTFYDLLAEFLGVTVTQEMRASAHELYTPSLKHHQLKLDNLSAEVPSYLKNFISILRAEKLNQTKNLDEIIDDFYFSKQFFLYNERYQTEQISRLNDELSGIQYQLEELKKSDEVSKAKLLKAQKEAQDRMISLRASAEKRFANALESAHEKLLASENEGQQRLLSTQKELETAKLTAKETIAKLRKESEQQLEQTQQAAKQELERVQNEAEQQLKEFKNEAEIREFAAKEQLEKINNEAIEERLHLEEQTKQQIDTAKKEIEQQLIEMEASTKERLHLEELTKQKIYSEKQEVEQQLIEMEAFSNELMQKAELAEKNLAEELERTKLLAKHDTTKQLERERGEAQKKLKKASEDLRLKTKEARELQNKRNLLQSQYEKLQRQHESLENDIRQRDEKLSISQEIFNKICTDQKFKQQITNTFVPGGYSVKKPFNPFAKKKNAKPIKEKAIISASGLFSPFYYLTNYPDVWKNNVNPLNHYCNEGWREGRNPGPKFNTRDYLALYDDVAGAGINPLVHYIQYGMKEGRHAFIDRSNRKVITASSSSKSKQAKSSEALRALADNYSGRTRAELDAFDGQVVTGWYLSKDSLPIVKINGVPANCLEYNSPEQETNFTFQSSVSVSGQAEVELLSLCEDGVKAISQKVFNKSSYILDKYRDVEKAYQICKDPKSVAITVWEGAHNPIGRAKVLYDVINTKRPVVIFAYVFGSFGKELWEPLRSSNLNVVLIPFEERLTYQRYLQDRGVKFNTVWICKHRLHSFELASMISRPDTSCILDMDDNEDVFVSSKGSELKPYGIFSKNKANYFLGKIPVRSVASISLQESYGGMLMRHARKKHVQTRSESTDTLTAVFIGTIRPHKNITELVSAITLFNDTTGIKLILAIGGDFDPPSMRETLDTPHTVILDDVSNDNLFDTLSKYDVLITGYPDESDGNKEINKYQITSKIGDGFATGKPVLTPYSPAVEDLQKTPGLFVFTPNNFNQKLKQALNYKKKISLPDEFTLDHSYKTFSKLEKLAKKESLAKNVFTLEPFYRCQSSSDLDKQNIVLIWKQHDAGIYGRRIDVVARYHKQRNPGCKVTVIEAVSERQLNHMMESRLQFDNSTLITNETLSLKLYQYSEDGVDYRLISFGASTGWNSFNDKFKGFLNAESIYPHNSVIILFPLHQVFDQLIGTLKSYKVIVDLVDNQIKWITTPEGRLKGLKQYYELISIADEVVANSPQNIAFFDGLNFFPEQKLPHFIPNWYTPPESANFKREANNTDEINLVYSGNLNDRIDWNLFADVCKALEPYNGKLHIAGSTIRRPEEMKELLDQPNCVYHGVVNEKQLLRLLQHMDFAVIPHLEDKISKFMDPIKLKMYKKLGLVSLSTKLPGLPENDPALSVANSSSEFLSILNEMLANCKNRDALPTDYVFIDVIGENYSTLIDKLSSSKNVKPQH